MGPQPATSNLNVLTTVRRDPLADSRLGYGRVFYLNRLSRSPAMSRSPFARVTGVSHGMAVDSHVNERDLDRYRARIEFALAGPKRIGRLERLPAPPGASDPRSAGV